MAIFSSIFEVLCAQGILHGFRLDVRIAELADRCPTGSGYPNVVESTQKRWHNK
jgi:hypothetical protein